MTIAHQYTAVCLRLKNEVLQYYTQFNQWEHNFISQYNDNRQALTIACLYPVIAFYCVIFSIVFYFFLSYVVITE